MKKNIYITLIFSLIAISSVMTQTITTAKVFTSNMVLQQNTQVPVWGWATAGTHVVISLTSTSSLVSSVTVTTDANGKWMGKLQTPIAIAGQAPQYTLTAIGPSNTITYTNVLVGEVWLCTGQSNMTFTMGPCGESATGVFNSTAEIALANYPNIRLFTTRLAFAATPQKDISGGNWSVCTPSSVTGTSAAAYYFGRELYTRGINIPIGLLVCAKSGSAVQTWINHDSIVSNPILNNKYAAIVPTATGNEATPSYYYNGMMAPLFPFAIKGAIWYQGESNTGDGTTYTKANVVMLKDWRKGFGSDFSFYAVHITPRLGIGATDLGYGRALFREYQADIQKTMTKTGIIATNDLMQNADERANSHPLNKKDVGIRLANWALAKDYGLSVQYLGPLYQSMVVEGSSIRITFKPESLGSGLISKDGKNLTCFRIAAAADWKFYPATAYISDNNTIIVNSPKVTKPAAVRFAFTEGSMANLMNKEGIIAYPFRTEAWGAPIYIDGAEPYTTGIKDIDIELFNVYPNPFVNKINVSGNIGDIKSVEMMDLTGRKINVQTTVNIADISMNTADLTQGLFLLNVKLKNNKSVSYKVIK